MIPLDDGSRKILAVQITCICIDTAAVVLRFTARLWNGQEISWDDGFMVVAWSLIIAYFGMVIKLTRLGSAQIFTGKVPPQDLYMVFKFGYAISIVFEVVNITVKTSLLFCFCRIFSTQEFRRQAMILGAFCAAWFIASVLTTIFQCIPVHKAWDREIPGRCINMDGFVLGYELTNALLDIALIVLPIRVIYTLKLSRRQKILVSLIFMLGGFVTVTSIVRIVYGYNPKNPLENFVKGLIWSLVSIASAVLCANLSVLKPLVSSSIIPKLMKSLYYYVTSAGNSFDGSKRKRSFSSYNNLGPSIDNVLLTIGGGPAGGKTRPKKKGEKDIYPLQSFNTVVEGKTVNI
ncbi:hypothetical protein BS50DRAFT_625400 [Corynespora cassiicola Philippines]|uniref:Rhodopsin domain-containing protein n=1 Tax=Corynespora cassiicola Philippines TaxID=1448308 RepID=A0A2T2N819_CORCC|nr:hypothetical protein BS50DRAFT_625400 [Corynespora cassiicola Philippines]